MILEKLINFEGGKHNTSKMALASSMFAVTTLAMNPVQAATFNYFDGTFNDADWTRRIHFNVGPVGSFSETATQSLREGNPEAFRRMTQSWGNGTSALVYHFNNNAIYDPATQGEIEFIDYSADVRWIAANVGGVFANGFAIEQDGRLFASANKAVAEVFPWQTKSFPGLTVADFVAVDRGPGPDFSSTGTPIKFGYDQGYRFDGLFTASLTSGIDNWSVTVNTVPPPNPSPSVPEPSSIIGLLGLGVLGMSRISKG